MLLKSSDIFFNSTLGTNLANPVIIYFIFYTVSVIIIAFYGKTSSTRFIIKKININNNHRLFIFSLALLTIAGIPPFLTFILKFYFLFYITKKYNSLFFILVILLIIFFWFFTIQYIFQHVKNNKINPIVKRNNFFFIIFFIIFSLLSINWFCVDYLYLLL